MKHAFRDWATACTCPPDPAGLHLPGPGARQADAPRKSVAAVRRGAGRQPAGAEREAPRCSRCTMTLKGRHWVMLWLAALPRRGHGRRRCGRPPASGMARRVRRLRQERATLEARQADFERRIRDASSRPVLGRKAQADLGLHFPRDSESGAPAAPAGRPGNADGALPGASRAHPGGAGALPGRRAGPGGPGAARARRGATGQGSGRAARTERGTLEARRGTHLRPERRARWR